MAKAVAAAREEAGLTQAELARRAKLARSAISELEHGRRNISFSSLLAVSRAVGLPLSDLIQRYEEIRRHKR